MRRSGGRAVALEGRIAVLDLRSAVVRDAGRNRVVGSVGFARENPAGAASAEAGAGPAGPFGRFGLEARRGRLRAAARYQLETGRERPGLLDLEGAWSSHDAAARLRWRGWSAPGVPRSAVAAPEDDGRMELDLRAGRAGAGATSLRVGSRPRQADGTGGERYVVGEMVVARERGRTLRLTAGRRDAQQAGRWRGGRSVGAIIDLNVRGAVGDEVGARGDRRERAALTLMMEAVRADRGTGAYGPSLEVAESGSLRARTRSGVRVAARGWIVLGSWRLGADADDEDDGTGVDETTTRGARAPRVHLWLAWSGGRAAP